MTLLTILNECSTKDLKRAYNSRKDYLFFDISVFNVGASIHIKCTDIYKIPSARTWNGYDCIHENDYLMNEFIEGVLKNRINNNL
jgi:hypothetical protein